MAFINMWCFMFAIIVSQSTWVLGDEATPTPISTDLANETVVIEDAGPTNVTLTTDPINTEETKDLAADQPQDSSSPVATRPPHVKSTMPPLVRNDTSIKENATENPNSGHNTHKPTENKQGEQDKGGSGNFYGGLLPVLFSACFVRLLY